MMAIKNFKQFAYIVALFVSLERSKMAHNNEGRNLICLVFMLAGIPALPLSVPLFLFCKSFNYNSYNSKSQKEYN